MAAAFPYNSLWCWARDRIIAALFLHYLGFLMVWAIDRENVIHDKPLPWLLDIAFNMAAGCVSLIIFGGIGLGIYCSLPADVQGYFEKKKSE